ncbi:MAG: hypothetical protein GFH27_549289n197 [Chloroflexi bacterium AL-W]|nr:hypothetical protein [Chloroflexi bacterium AL-N1]NOK66930.1 hypothetical protein [Chloroflexi bacterium AL-N10]NOK74778.1 hypothetical protein [Chloroflexi bacterium AL-N5]NOK81532.1 hypothetical protein [Chloroflexi bacterium AL-W]NOK89002.1 hypothetical protein [Chloroflexi bacterium AL-N15]
MAIFDQRKQHVKTQNNINIGYEQCSKEDIISILNSLKQDFDQSVQDNIIDVEIGNEANTQLQRALTEFQKEEPNKQIILDSIDNTKK